MFLYLLRQYLKHLKKRWHKLDVLSIRAMHDRLLKKIPLAPHTHIADKTTPYGTWRYIVPNDLAYDTYILHFHGGSLCMGGIESHSAHASYIAKATRTSVILPSYRLAPEHPYPASFEDAMAIYNYLTKHLGIPDHKIILSADSAGALLAFHIVHTLLHEKKTLPQMMLLFAPSTSCEILDRDELYTDYSLRDPFLDIHLLRLFKSAVFQDRPTDDPIISPIYADYKDYIPFFSVIGSDDLLLDPLRRLHIQAIKAGVDCQLLIQKHAFHGHYFFPRFIPQAQEAYTQAAHFMHTRLKKSHET